MALADIRRVRDPASPEGEAAMALYRRTFPEWEREPEAIVSRRIRAGDYWLLAGRDASGSVVGMYIMELNQRCGYALLTFLAVEPSHRGAGYGRALCADAVRRFHEEMEMAWLLVEGEAAQAAFYGKMGFRRFAMDYAVPRFGESGTVPMHLMAMTAGDARESATATEVKMLVEDIFRTGYLLEDDDPRLAEQLAKVPDPVVLRMWPPGE